MEHRVREVLAEDVEVGMIVWAHNDGDWLAVFRIIDDGFGRLEFRRRDGSLAEFDADKLVLVRID